MRSYAFLTILVMAVVAIVFGGLALAGRYDLSIHARGMSIILTKHDPPASTASTGQLAPR